jgi:hypothetical protein
MVAHFSRKVDWETTVQLLETCLWKRQKNKANAFLTYLRCRYTIRDNLNAIPESILQSQLARLRSPSSSPAHYEDQVDEAYEPRLRYLGLPYWGIEGSSHCWDAWDSRHYPSKLLLPLLKELPYVAQISPYSFTYSCERVLEDSVEDDDIVATVDGESSTNTRSGRRSRGGTDSRKEKKDLGPRYRWRKFTCVYEPETPAPEAEE